MSSSIERREKTDRAARLGRLALLLLALGGLAGAAGAQHGERAAQAEKLFRGSCVHCHVAPDPGFAVDRAWLAQVRDTA